MVEAYVTGQKLSTIINHKSKHHSYNYAPFMMVVKVENCVEKLPDNIGSGGNFTEISNSLPDDYFIQSRVGGPACERISETTDDSNDFCRYHENNRSAEKCKALSMDFLDSVEEVKSLQGETKMKVPFPVPDHIGPACRLKFHEIGKYINEKNRLELGSNAYQHAASSVPSSPFKNDFHLERCIYFDNPERNEAMRNAAIQRFIDSNNFETKRNITPTLLFNTSLRRRSQVLTQLDNVKSYCRKMRQSLCEAFFKKSNMKVGERITASDVDVSQLMLRCSYQIVLISYLNCFSLRIRILQIFSSMQSMMVMFIQ